MAHIRGWAGGRVLGGGGGEWEAGDGLYLRQSFAAAWHHANPC